jgi:hypothetical protein
MSSQFDDLAKRIRALPLGEKAALFRELIDDLDPGQDPDVERLWLEELSVDTRSTFEARLKRYPVMR